MVMRGEKIHLTKEKETLLATLYARAIESRSQHPILVDTWAEILVDRIDYDFHRLGIGRNDAVAIAIRAKQLDVWTAEFLTHNPEAIVLHLGCGLDARLHRIDPHPAVEWYDIDYPDVIELRRRLFTARHRHMMVGCSVTDPQWLDEIPANRPVMIVAEGLLSYLAADEIRRLLRRLTDHFPRGHLAFDAFNRLGVKLMRNQPPIVASGASLNWAIDDPREIEQQNPRLQCMRESSILGSPYIAKMDYAFRWMCAIYSQIPALAGICRVLLYSF